MCRHFIDDRAFHRQLIFVTAGACVGFEVINLAARSRWARPEPYRVPHLFLAVWAVSRSRSGISSRELRRAPFHPAIMGFHVIVGFVGSMLEIGTRIGIDRTPSSRELRRA